MHPPNLFIDQTPGNGKAPKGQGYSASWSMAFWWRKPWDSGNPGLPPDSPALAFVDPQNLGLVTGADGCIGLAKALVRIPDVAFVSWDRIPDGQLPEEPIPDLVPDLVVEVISRGNTRREMDEKLEEYFDKGVRLVWFVRPRSRVVDVYTSADGYTRLTASATLDGGSSAARLFSRRRRPVPQTPGPEPGEPRGKRRQS